MTKEEFSLLFHRAQVNLVAFKQLYEPEAFEAMQRMVEMAINEEREEFAKHAVEIARNAIKKEREACAQVCEDNADDLSEGDWDSACIGCANQIRARGNK